MAEAPQSRRRRTSLQGQAAKLAEVPSREEPPVWTMVRAVRQLAAVAAWAAAPLVWTGDHPEAAAVYLMAWTTVGESTRGHRRAVGLMEGGEEEYQEAWMSDEPAPLR